MVMGLLTDDEVDPDGHDQRQIFGRLLVEQTEIRVSGVPEADHRVGAALSGQRAHRQLGATGADTRAGVRCGVTPCHSRESGRYQVSQSGVMACHIYTTDVTNTQKHTRKIVRQ